MDKYPKTTLLNTASKYGIRTNPNGHMSSYSQKTLGDLARGYSTSKGSKGFVYND